MNIEQQTRYNRDDKTVYELALPGYGAPVSYAESEIMAEVFLELDSARARYPDWPIDIVHATVVMVEEATESLKAASEVRWQHKETTPAEVRKEVIQTMAMCLRLLTETPGL